jgi:hypothetical protein
MFFKCLRMGGVLATVAGRRRSAVDASTTEAGIKDGLATAGTATAALPSLS